MFFLNTSLSLDHVDCTAYAANEIWNIWILTAGAKRCSVHQSWIGTFSLSINRPCWGFSHSVSILGERQRAAYLDVQVIKGVALFHHPAFEAQGFDEWVEALHIHLSTITELIGL